MALVMREKQEKWLTMSKMIASCGFLEDEMRQRSKEEGVEMADSVDTQIVSSLEKEGQEVESERTSEKSEVQCEILAWMIRAGMVSARTGSLCSGDGSHGEVEH